MAAQICEAARGLKPALLRTDAALKGPLFHEPRIIALQGSLGKAAHRIF